MPDHSLPDDLNDWPRDPYAILGVRFGVSAIDLRRAYTRLIRVFKPEQSPEQFRRIREAYETVQGHLQFFGASSRSAEEEKAEHLEQLAAPGETQEVLRIMPREVEGAAHERTALPRHSERDLKAIWNLACSGREKDAYEQLLRLLDAAPGSEEIYIRLYWILVAAPEVDTRRWPHDWLILGLKANGLTGPMRELFRREIEDDPEIALNSAAGALLRSNVAPDKLLDFAQWRWQAAGVLASWRIVFEDVADLREYCQTRDEETWVRLLLLAIDQAAWAEVPEAQVWIDNRCNEIESQQHLHMSMSSEMDRLDFLRILLRNWRQLALVTEFASALRKLIPISWSLPYTRLRGPLVEFLREIAIEPAKALRVFSGLRTSAPAILSQFGNMLYVHRQHLGDALADDRPPSLVEPFIENFLANHKIRQFESFREKLLKFCLDEAVMPNQVANVLEKNVGYCEAVQSIRDDLPMRHVVDAHRLFWA